MVQRRAGGPVRSGRLGNGLTTDSSVTVAVDGLNDGVTAISAGFEHTCAIQNGAAKCWGANGNGQLGRGSGNQGNTLIPGAVSGLDGGVTAIAAGASYTCVIQDGAAKCWGANDDGRLGRGIGNQGNTLIPEVVSRLDGGVTAITVGAYHTCAIQRGSAWCWGRGGDGQLGDRMIQNSETPVRVPNLDHSVTAIAVGFAHSCAVVGAAARCWGRGSEGQLGNATPS